VYTAGYLRSLRRHSTDCLHDPKLTEIYIQVKQLHLSRRLRGRRSGRARQAMRHRTRPVYRYQFHSTANTSGIPVYSERYELHPVGDRLTDNGVCNDVAEPSKRVQRRCRNSATTIDLSSSTNISFMPRIMHLNPTSLAKPDAIPQLQA